MGTSSCYRSILESVAENSNRTTEHALARILKERIAIIDGAMGTTIRTYGMTEADMRGERFQDRPRTC